MSFRSLAARLLLAMSLALPIVSSAQYIDPKRIESSLLVTGTIDIAADGSVLGYALDQPAKVVDPDPQGTGISRAAFARGFT